MRRMTRSLLPILLLLLCSEAFAQQLTHFSQYMLNGYLINPAVAGAENYGELKTGYRSQWAGVEGAPESFYLTVHTPLGKMNRKTTATSSPYRGRTGSKALRQNYQTKDVLNVQQHHGLGLSIIQDKAGVLKRTDAGLTYAYHMPVSRSLMVSAGLTGGFSLYQVNEAELQLTNPNDPAFLAGDYNQAKPNVTAGVLLYSKRFYVGASSAQLFQDELSARFGESEENSARSRVHHTFTSGYKIYLTPGLSVLPSVLLKYASPAPLAIDANLKLQYQDRFWVGGSYRPKQTLVALAGINLNNLLQVGYAYDIGKGGMNHYSSGSHEVVIGFLLHNRDKVFSPSDFW
jgi:type IX secretion system PorP/SprF family membrane protein